MNQIDIDKVNARITYEEARIYWEPNKGLTSGLFKRLYSKGWRTSRAGLLIQLKDQCGRVVCSGLTRSELLFNLSKLMR